MTKRWGRALGVIALSMIVPLVPFLAVGELPGETLLRAQADHAMRFGLTGFALLCADVFLPIPSSLVGSMLGLRLGTLVGFGWTFGGLFVGHLVGYGTARGALSLRLRRRGESRRREPRPLQLPLGGALVALTRCVPVFAEAVALAAGATRMPLGRFVAACAAGNAVYAFVVVANGDLLLGGDFPLLGWLLPLAIPLVGYLWYRRRLRI